jgi:hypothetical protein
MPKFEDVHSVGPEMKSSNKFVDGNPKPNSDRFKVHFICNQDQSG